MTEAVTVYKAIFDEYPQNIKPDFSGAIETVISLWKCVEDEQYYLVELSVLFEPNFPAFEKRYYFCKDKEAHDVKDGMQWICLSVWRGTGDEAMKLLIKN